MFAQIQLWCETAAQHSHDIDEVDSQVQKWGYVWKDTLYAKHITRIHNTNSAPMYIQRDSTTQMAMHMMGADSHQNYLHHLFSVNLGVQRTLG